MSEERIDWSAVSDETLVGQCDIDLYRASGPGGQKRNKTSSAVRLRHRPTGAIITAVDSRSQHQNRARALKRLRAALAYDVRQPLADRTPPPLVAAAAAEQLQWGPKREEFLPVAAWLLDAMLARQGRMAETAADAGVSTGVLVRFLASEPDLWQAANRVRAACGQKPLKLST